jgi:hypothetical protein
MRTNLSLQIHRHLKHKKSTKTKEKRMVLRTSIPDSFPLPANALEAYRQIGQKQTTLAADSVAAFRQAGDGPSLKASRREQARAHGNQKSKTTQTRYTAREKRDLTARAGTEKRTGKSMAAVKAVACRFSPRAVVGVGGRGGGEEAAMAAGACDFWGKFGGAEAGR